MYKYFLKRIIDIILSFIGIIVLSIPMLIIAICIKLDSPGPVLFRQKRIGIGKREFYILKFRSMSVYTPHDMPTNQLTTAESYITRVGAILRKYSLDELPQMFNIFSGNMTIIGPRPALFNQAELICERDKYGANDIKPGLTGWAQINGRDELPIDVKAKLDGDYTVALNAGHFKGFAMDFRCFVGTIAPVIKHKGVVEGGTGKMKKEETEKKAIV